MNIKEAGYYANYLSAFLLKLNQHLLLIHNVSTIKETHNKNKVTGKAEDLEIKLINKSKESNFEYDILSILPLCKKIIEEKAKLSVAIANAKSTLTIAFDIDSTYLSLDAAIEYNKAVRERITMIERILVVKPSTSVEKGTGYIFNVEGVQVPYVYEIEKEIIPTFDRSTLVSELKKLNRQADLLSKLIDQAMLQDSVIFEPAFDMYETL